jgi:isopentenyl diphosphate isomerase/L-lactate dehydrogenase-like FMN-dependent dehydrogenase
LPNFLLFNYIHRGLAHSGEEGVYNVVKLLNDELALAMKLMGAITIAVSASESAITAIYTLT